jgi:hypothetical protein
MEVCEVKPVRYLGVAETLVQPQTLGEAFRSR